jgi:hypothetical protein
MLRLAWRIGSPGERLSWDLSSPSGQFDLNRGGSADLSLRITIARNVQSSEGPAVWREVAIDEPAFRRIKDVEWVTTTA